MTEPALPSPVSLSSAPFTPESVAPQSVPPAPVPAAPTPSPAAPITSGSALLIEIFRSIGAAGVLFACAILMVRSPAWQLSIVDVVYWAIVILLLAAQRHAARIAGTTGTLLRGWGRVVAVTLLVWAVAHTLPLLGRG